MLVKSFKPKRKKGKNAEADFWKNARPVPRDSAEWAAHERALAQTAAIMKLTSSDDPFEREWARKAVGM